MSGLDFEPVYRKMYSSAYGDVANNSHPSNEWELLPHKTNKAKSIMRK